jgi:tetratricopeptide (TPR) repeat protein
MQKWKSVIDRMEAIEPKSNDFLLELVNFHYGYIAWCIGNNNNDEAKKYLDLAESALSVLSKDNKNLSRVNAYKAAFYGYKIGMNRVLAPFIGMNSINCAKQAITLDKYDPLGYIQYANIQFYIPSVFGGSKKEALEYYLHAQELIEKDEKNMNENWNYLSLLVTIAQSYSYLNDFKSSIAYMEKILKIEPEFSWVKNELYPQVLTKMKEF